MNSELTVTDNEFQRQFECNIEGELTCIEYSQQDRKIFLTKVGMSEDLREKGYFEAFLSKVLEEIRERETRVVPTSPDIAKFMRKNRRKYKDLLPVGINI